VNPTAGRLQLVLSGRKFSIKFDAGLNLAPTPSLHRTGKVFFFKLILASKNLFPGKAYKSFYSIRLFQRNVYVINMKVGAGAES
jgi:hypothetical protein